VAVRDHSVGEIIRRKRHSHAISEDHADAVFAHAPAQLCANDRAGVGLDLELATCENLRHQTFELYVIVASQAVLHG
jgi:hypothetical protein